MSSSDGILASADAAPAVAREKQFDWPVCYEVEEFLLNCLSDFLDRNNFARQLAQRMRDETGTLLLDWIDHVVLPASKEPEMRRIGFVPDPVGETAGGVLAFHHPSAMLPPVLLRQSDADFPPGLA